MHVLRPVRRLIRLAAVVAVGIAAALSGVMPDTTQAQSVTSTISIASNQTSVYEGGLAIFTLSRHGGHVRPLAVPVKIWEPNQASGSSNPTEMTHTVNFRRGSRVATLRVVPFVDTTAEPGAQTLNAQVQASADDSYQVDATDTASVDILDHPSDNSVAVIEVSRPSGQFRVVEGTTVPFTFTRTGGDTTQPLTVEIDVNDPGEFLRGDYWDTPPVIPSQVTFAAGSTSETLDLEIPNDKRDLPPGSFRVEVLPSRDYLLSVHDESNTTSAAVNVTDDDTSQELELNFGKDGTNDADVDEGDTLKFSVKRRQQDADTGVTAGFTVRVETDRGGPDHVLEGWGTDSATSRRYKDFHLELTGSDTEVEQEIGVTENGGQEDDWVYKASILPIEDHDGSALTVSEEAQYWTIKSGFRETEVAAADGGDMTGTVTIAASTITVYEGAGVTYTLTRTGGPIGRSATVGVRTWEPRRRSGGSNPSNQTTSVHFDPWETTATFTISAYVDGVDEAGADALKAKITSVSAGYATGTPDEVDLEIDDPPANSALITVARGQASITEGQTGTFTLTRTGGDITQALTVDLRVDDNGDYLRGNHWEPAPDLPTEATFEVNSTTVTVSLAAPDDDRDLPNAGLITLNVLPGTGYLLGQTGTEASATISTTDNDTAQVLSLDWGYLDPTDPSWRDGESYAPCTLNSQGTYDCTSGPAEGFYFYEDGRNFRFSHEFEEPWPIHFEVSRRAQDVGTTATFVVRVEHTRGWESARHADWPIDPATGRHYQEFPLTLTGDQRKVIGRIEVLDNGLKDPPRWQYTATIKQIQDVNGAPLAAGEENEYWTVRNPRTRTLRAAGEIPYPEFKIKLPNPAEVAEGQDVTFSVERKFGNPHEPLPVQLRTWEPNRANPDGTNPTEQVHNLEFPAVALTSDFQRTLEQTLTFTVTVTDDAAFETTDLLKTELVTPKNRRGSSVVKGQVDIIDNDQPTITLTADQRTITEGEAVSFTLTRGNNTAGELIVDVRVDDPGEFLQGDYPGDRDGVEAPTSVRFADGDTTKTITIIPPDDRRDIPDSTLTFTVEEKSAYEVLGTNPQTIQVADNDVAPQVQISFNHAEVEEGQDLILTITRIGEDKNDLEIPMTGGRVDDQRFTVIGLDPGESLAILRYRLPDNEFKGPDVAYSFTLQPENLELWTPTGDTTVTAKIVDNDPYRVRVRAFRASVDEGQQIYYRISHDGYTDEALQVQVTHSELGNAVGDGILGGETHTITAGESGITRAYPSHANDGSDGDAEFTVALVASDDYEIDPDRASATITVVDKDPLPVLRFESFLVEYSESVGTARHVVQLVSDLPVLRDVSIDYQVQEQFVSDGEDITESMGTLTIPAGETTGVIEIPIIQDKLAESDETFFVYLRNPVHTTLQYGVSSLRGWGTILDDEPTVTLESSHTAINEGTDAVFTLTRDEDTTDELTAWVQVVQSRPVNENVREAVVFAAGEDMATLTIPTENYRAPGGRAMTISATLLDPADVGELRTYRQGTTGSVLITVRDVSLPDVTVSAEETWIREGDTATFTFNRQNGEWREFTIDIEVAAESRFVSSTLPTTITFPEGDSSVTLDIETDGDSTAEDNGEITVSIKDGRGYRPRFPSTVTTTVFDDDSGFPDIRVTKAADWVNEGDDVTFTFTRSGSTTDPLDFKVSLWRMRYRATRADLDDPTRFVTTPGSIMPFDQEDLSLTFSAGESRLTVTRSTTDDVLNFGNSSYHARVESGADSVYTAVADHTEQVWVQDDDRPTVTMTPATLEAVGGIPIPGLVTRTLVAATISRTGDTSGNLTTNILSARTNHQPPPAADRYESGGAFGSFVEGEAAADAFITSLLYVNFMGLSGTHTFTSPHYCPDEPAECRYRPQYVLGSDTATSFRAYGALMGVRIEANQATFEEGTDATFTLHRLGGKKDAMDRPLQVRVAVTQDGDYISGTTPVTVDFAAGQSTTTLTVPTNNDTVDEANGTIRAEILYPTSYTDDEYAYEIRKYVDTPWFTDYFASTEIHDDDYVPPTVSVADATGKEQDETIEFTISLDAANNQEQATVIWTTAEDGTGDAATSDTDYTAATGTVTFAIGATEQTVAVSLLDDDLDENHETFNLVLSSPSGAALGDDTATGTILDDELAVAVILYSATGNVVEGENLSFRAKRLPPRNPGETVNVNDPCYTGGAVAACFNPSPSAADVPDSLTISVRVTEDGEVISGAAPTTVTFQPGSVFADVVVATVDDSTVEPDGIVTAEVLNGSGYSPLYLGLTENPDSRLPSATRTVYDNDLTFSVQDAQAGEADGQLNFIVSLNAPAAKQVTVNVATVDGRATSSSAVTANSLGQDFEAKAETLTFEIGDQIKVFSVTVVDDTIHEKSETFEVRLRSPPDNASLADATALGTILDNEEFMVASVSRSYAVVNENQVGPVKFTVTLSHPITTNHERSPAVAWQTVAGTATEGEDYAAGSDKVIFKPGETTGYIEVDLTDDSLIEATLESFSVELADTDSRLVTLSSTNASYEAFIRDNETLTASIVANAENVVEGQDAAFTVRLVGGVTTADAKITFEVSESDSAKTYVDTEDYGTPVGNLTLPEDDDSGAAGTLTIPAGQSSGTITYPINLDTDEEDPEAMEVRIFTVSDDLKGGGVSGTQYKASTEILDSGTLTASIAGAPTVTEGGTATFTVTLSKTSGEDVLVGWSTRTVGDTLDTGETAEPDVDYTADTDNLSIDAGTTSATFTVQTTDDTLVEGAETFVVTLDEATKGTDVPPELVPLGTTSATGTITDNDTAPDGLTVTVTPDRVTEGDGATDITVTVSLDGTAQFTTDTPVALTFMDRTATMGEDYTGETVNAVILAGQSSVTTTVTLTVVDDDLAEVNERVRLVASSSALTDSAYARIVIEDNDIAPGEVQIHLSPDVGDESAQNVAIQVMAELNGGTTLPLDVEVDITTTGGTATAGEDFTTATTTVTIPAGERNATATLNLPVLEDTLDEADETLTVTGTVMNLNSLNLNGGLPVQADTFTIRDNDTAPTSIGLSVTGDAITEGGSAVTLTVRATLQGGGTRLEATTVSLAMTDVTATLTDDYTVAGSLPVITIPAGNFYGEATVTIAPVQDSLYEGRETVAVSGSNLVPGLPVSGVLLTIQDDDPAPTTIALSIDPGSVSESVGSTFADVTATIEGDSTLTDVTQVRVELDLTGTAVRSTQFSSLVIPAGERSAESKLLLTNLNDDVDDDDEKLELRGTSDNPELTVNPAELVVTDDDTAGLSISPVSLTVSEGGHNRYYTVKLNSQPTSDVTVTVDLPANAGFTASPGSLTFTSASWGAQSVSVSATQDDDAADEPAKTITHSISTTDEQYKSITAPGVSVAVRDDDDPLVSVSYGTATYSVAESDDPSTTEVTENEVTVTVTLSADPEREVVIPVETAEQGGATSADYSGVPANVTIASGATEATFTFTATADTVDDDGESVKLTFGDLPTRVTEGTTKETVVAITDDDDPAVSVSFGAATYSVAESDDTSTTEAKENEVVVTVALSADPEREVVIPLEKTEQAGATSADYSGVPANVTIASGATAATFTFTATADTVDDDGESVKLTFGTTLPTGVSEGTTTEAIVAIADDDLPADVKVAFEQAAYSVVESDDASTTDVTENEVTVTVTLSEDPEQTVIIPIDKANQGGATSADYSGVPANVTFASGDTAKSFTFTATADTVDDDGESVKLTFGDLPTRVTEGTTKETVVAITDDDDPAVSVSFGAATYSVAETDDTSTTEAKENEVVVTVALSADPEREVVIPLEKTEQAGATSADYSGVPANVTIASGATEATFTFTATADTVDDDGESVKLTLGTLPTGVSEGTTTETVVAITDDDDPAVSVSFGAATYSVAESDDTGTTEAKENEVVVTVTLSADPERTVTIPLVNTDQGGATSADYSGVPANVTFASGDTAKSFTFTATADTVDDDGESVKLTFGTTLPTGVTEGTTKATVVSITDDDVPSVDVEFGSATYSVDETDDASTTEDKENEVVVTVTLSADPERTVTIGITTTDQGEVNQSQASSADYSGVPANVVFNSGEISTTFTFAAKADTVDDDGESVKLSFNSLPAGVTEGTIKETVISINDDDLPADVDVEFEQATYTAAEGSTVTVTVTLSEDPERSVTIPIVKSNQGGTSSSDYSGVPNNITFYAGDTAKSFTFSAASDSVDDDGESVKLTFGTTLPTGVTEGTTKATVVSITDDDVPSVDVEFGSATYSVDETDDASTTEDKENEVVVTVTLSADPERTVTIGITTTDQGEVNQSQASSADYSGVPANVVFNSGEISTTFTFAAKADTVDDDGESVKLSFNSLPAGVTEGTIKETVISINDDDLPADVDVEFEQATYTAAEGSTVTVTVTLSEDPERSVTIPIVKSNQGGTSSSDYSGVPNNITFYAGDTAKSFTFSAASDSVDDDGESVKLTFGTTLPTGVTEGTTKATVVSITDDDVPSVDVEFGSATYSVDETDDASTTEDKENEVVVTVTLSADPERTVTIGITTTDQGEVNQSQASSADYSGVPANVVFNSGEISTTFTFAAKADTVDDDGESVKLSFNSLPAGVTEGTIKETVISINDDDLPADVDVEFEQATYTAAEGSTVTVTVTLSEDPERSVTIPIVKSNQGGTSSSDYSGVPNNITFYAGDTAKSFTFSAASDSVDDDGESVKLTFGTTLPTGVTEGTTKATVVSITDDDVPSVDVEFGSATYSVEETDDSTTPDTTENEVTVTVTLSADPERTVTIPIEETGQGGATSADYSGVPANVTFASGDTETSFTFTATADTVDDDGESVKLTFGTTLPTGVSEGTAKETVVAITDDDDPAVTVSFGAATYSVAESDDPSTTEDKENEVVVTVALSADPERTVVIPLIRAVQGGATSADYSGVPANVTIASGATAATFTFTATADTVDDDDESVKVTFSNLTSGVSEGTTKETVVSITDDDVPAVRVSFEEDRYTVAEGASVTVTVELDVDPERTVVIPIDKTNQGGATDSDYSGVPADVTFASGDTAKSFTVGAVRDNLDDSGESVKLTFATLPSQVTAGTTNETTINIATTSAQNALAVSFEAGAYLVAEGGTTTVKVTLNVAPGSDVVISLVKSEQGGATSADYSGVPAGLTFGSSDTEQSFTFTATADTVDDDDESVKLTFDTLPSGVSEGTTKETVIAIDDDDDPAVSVSYGAATYSVAESDDASTTEDKENEVVVTVALSADPERTVIIPIATANQGGATSGDYSGVPANVTFASGDTAKSFTFTATADTVDDDDETVKLTFGTTLPTGVSEGTTKETVVAITDDDDPSVTVSFGAATYSVAESDDASTPDVSEHQVTISVTLSADPERTVTIPLDKAEQGGATSADYSGVPANVTFANGDTAKSFTFSATADTVDDDGESVKLTFGTLPSGVSEGATDETVVAIADDDKPTSLTANFKQSAYTAAEGGTVTVTVTLNDDPEREVVIPLEKADQGGATSADYSGVPANVTFASGDTAKSFTFTATADTVDDDGESVKLTFGTTLPTGMSEGTTKETVIAIADDDDPSVTVSFGASSYSVAESDDTSTTEVSENQVTVTVTLSADPERTVTIPLVKTDQGGATSADYGGVPANVTFANGDTAKSFTFSATADTVDDDGESVKLTFATTLPTRVSEGTTKETVIDIADDDDPAVSVSFGASSYTVAESDDASTTEVSENQVTITVTLSADPERTVTVPIDTANQGGATGADYSGVPANVTFANGDTAKSFTFSATADTVDDDGETVKLTFGDLPTGVNEGTTKESVVSITDDDLPTDVKVAFEQATYTVAENSSVTVTVTLSEDPERTVTIPLETAVQSGATSADYSGVPANLTFNSGDTAKSFTFSATADTVDDDGESVKLTFGTTLPTGVSEGTTKETVVAIGDDDDPSVTVSFGASSYTVAESDDASTTEVSEHQVSISVTLSADPERTVTIPIVKTDQGGATSADYSGVPANVTFQSGDTAKSFTFSATADTVDDDGESVKLTLGDLPTGVSEGTTKEAVVSITDDDDPTVSVSFGAATHAAAEGSSVTVSVNLSADPERTVVIPLTKTEQGGATSADYSGVPSDLTFTSGTTEQSFIFSATQDTLDDDNESVKLDFGNLPGGVTTGTTSTSTVSINDDDVTVRVSFGASAYSATEGGPDAMVTVQLSTAAPRQVTIPLTAEGRGGATPSDWSGVPESLSFDAGDTAKSFTLVAVDDTVEDDGEMVRLGIGALPAGFAHGSPATSNVTLMNDDTEQQTLYQCPSDSGRRIILDSVGQISKLGESQYWSVELDFDRTYIVEVLGKDGGRDILGEDTYDGDLTLEHPGVVALWNHDRSQLLTGSDTARNRFTVERGGTASGWHQIEVQGNGGTGTYQIKVRVNNVCINRNGYEQYPYFGGPDGYVLDTPKNSSTTRSLDPRDAHGWKSLNNYLGDNWSWYREREPDEDWFATTLRQNHEYTIVLWTSDALAGKFQATDLKILGIRDENGSQIADTASSSSGRRVSVNFTAPTDGRYFILVGSGSADRTGVYSISIELR